MADNTALYDAINNLIVNTEQYCPIRAHWYRSLTEEVFYPVQLIGDSINLQLNRQFIVDD